MGSSRMETVLWILTLASWLWLSTGLFLQGLVARVPDFGVLVSLLFGLQPVRTLVMLVMLAWLGGIHRRTHHRVQGRGRTCEEVANRQARKSSNETKSLHLVSTTTSSKGRMGNCGRMIQSLVTHCPEMLVVTSYRLA